MKKTNVLMMLYAIGSTLFIDLIGRLTVAEVLVLITMPFTEAYKKIRQFYGLRTILVCLLLLFFFQIISDVVNQSVFRDWARGLTVMLMTILLIVFFINQLNININSIIYLLFGLAIANIIFGDPFETAFKVKGADIIKYISILLSFYLYKLNKFKTSVVIILLFSLLFFSLDSRSNGLICFMSAFLLGIKILKPNQNKLFFTTCLLVFSIIPYILYTNYVSQVLSKNFGGNHALSQLTKVANPYNPFEVLYSGRIGLAVAGYAIKDKPLLGHGSWAQDKDAKYSKITSVLTGGKLRIKKIIPSHSIIIGAWLNMGIFGFIISLYLFYTFIKLFFRVYFRITNNKYLPIIIILSVEMMWHFLFSPFGHIKNTFPIIISLLIIVNSKYFNNE